MVRLSHRDMLPEERVRLEDYARRESLVGGGWSSHGAAVLILLLGSFLAGILFFGLPLTLLVGSRPGTHLHDLLLFLPGIVMLVGGGGWSVVYYLRGSWRVSRELLEDLDYDRVEVIEGRVDRALVIEAGSNTAWLLDMGEEVLLLRAEVVPNASPRTFPGREVRVVRCKHSGLVLKADTEGPALAPLGRVKAGGVTPLESARFDGAIEDVCRRAVVAA